MRNNLLRNTGEVLFDFESDGRKINSGRDPPGQKSVYIPPGDTERETYRLTTFRSYPRNSPIDPLELTSSGFYYIGYKDRVKCFSCGHSVDNWLATDNVASSGWHDNRCEFMNGIDERNVPIRDTTPKEKRIYPGNSPINPPELASSGFYYVGYKDRVKCFRCYNEVESLFSCTTNLVDVLSDSECFTNSNNPGFVPTPPTSDVINHVSLQSDDAMRCRICKRKIISIVFYPCSHVVCCTSCGWRRERCPVCNQVIQRRVLCFIYF